MRSSAYKIIALFYIFTGLAFAVDLSKYENTCVEIGFKRKTPAFGECVLELHGRENKATTTSARQQKSVQSTNSQGDGTPDHIVCAKYGFQVGTPEYSQCRMQIDTAKRAQAQNQLRFEAEQIRYEEEQRQYEARLAEYERQKKRQESLAIIQFGLALASGTSSNFYENLGNASRQSLGLAPLPPQQPAIQNFSIISRSGIRNCTLEENLIHCF